MSNGLKGNGISSFQYTRSNLRELSGLHLVSCYVGGFLAQIGWLVLLVGSMGSWNLIAKAGFEYLKYTNEQIVFILVVPLSGILLLFWAYRKARPVVNLLRNGRIALATVVEKEPTNVEINDQPVYRYTLEFKDSFDSPHRTKASTHRSDIFSQDIGQKKKVLYNPDNPSNAVVVALLPKGIRFDISENLLTAILPKANIILPLATLVFNFFNFVKVFT